MRRPRPRRTASALALFALLGSLPGLVAACGGATAPDAREAPGAAAAAGSAAGEPVEVLAGQPMPVEEGEVRLRNLRQLTFGGENAEAYWSPDGRRLIFQATRGDAGCDQQYVLDLVTGEERRVSNGEGRTTCGYFGYPGGEWLLYASTHHDDPGCPAPPDRSQGYVWPLEELDVFRMPVDGGPLVNLTDRPGYDAEATVRFTDGRVVFTSDRDGDLDLYTMRPDGSDVRRVTDTLGYDGGAFFSPDGRRLVWRASRPEGAEAQATYRVLLARRMVRPGALELFVANADGGSPRQVTANGAANFAPYFLPDSRRVIFSSNVGGDAREFDLYVVDPDAPADADGDRPLERITTAPGFDGFPMFSPDGRHLVFASNRHGSRPGETNLFVAEWVEDPDTPAEGGGER